MSFDLCNRALVETVPFMNLSIYAYQAADFVIDVLPFLFL
jgi:hypothetical protein